MGINTVAVLFNDQTNEFRRSGPLGERIADAMTAGWSMRDRDRLATWFGCGQVISQAHADYSQVVVVGQNGGCPISECNKLDQYAITQIVAALVREGYSVKAPPRVKRKPA